MLNTVLHGTVKLITQQQTHFTIARARTHCRNYRKSLEVRKLRRRNAIRQVLSSDVTLRTPKSAWNKTTRASDADEKESPISVAAYFVFAKVDPHEPRNSLYKTCPKLLVLWGCRLMSHCNISTTHLVQVCRRRFQLLVPPWCCT